MKIAVIADIHGNHIALEHSVRYAMSRNVDTFIFLGDYLGELAYPQKTMQFLYHLNENYECYFVKGNREDYWLDYRKENRNFWQDGNSTTGSLLYNYQNLTEKDFQFFESLPLTRTLSFEGLPDLLICHGSPERANEKMLAGKERTFALMENCKAPVILCGHTHEQEKIVHNGKCVLNPGSVGVPLKSGGKAQFMILHGECGVWQEEFLSFHYDVDETIRELHEEKLDVHAPYWCMISEHVLRGGAPAHGTVLNYAMELCKKETGNCEWPDVPEQYWAKAVSSCFQKQGIQEQRIQP